MRHAQRPTYQLNTQQKALSRRVFFNRIRCFGSISSGYEKPSAYSKPCEPCLRNGLDQPFADAALGASINFPPFLFDSGYQCKTDHSKVSLLRAKHVDVSGCALIQRGSGETGSGGSHIPAADGAGSKAPATATPQPCLQPTRKLTLAIPATETPREAANPRPQCD